MSHPGYLDFFVLEASEYVERLDTLVGAADTSGPDAPEFARVARALRGSATMARAGGMAELAGGIERAGRSLRDGTLWWDPKLRGALTAAVDDCKILLRSLKTWGAAEDARVRARVAELASFAPPWRGGTPTPAAGAPRVTGAAEAPAGGAALYLATAASGIVAALDDLTTRPQSREALANALGRVRALRGVAAVKDLPPLAEVVEAIERAGKSAELSGAMPGAAQVAVLSAAAEVLRRVSAELSAGRRPVASGPDVERLATVTAALDEERSSDADRIVPIADLFFADAGPHVVARAPNPPTTPPERFRLEVVSQAEHLRRLVADAREARGGERERAGRALRAALHALEESAHGFAEREVAGFVASYKDAAEALDAPALAAIDEVAALLADPTSQSGELARRLGELSRARRSGSGARVAVPTPGAGSSRLPTPAAAQGVVRDRQRTPTGRQLHALLETGIAGFSLLERQPLSEPEPAEADAEAEGERDVVPIESLVYRGRAALARARELRETLRASLGDTNGGGAGVAALDQAALDELLDLLDLAATE